MEGGVYPGHWQEPSALASPECSHGGSAWPRAVAVTLGPTFPTTGFEPGLGAPCLGNTWFPGNVRASQQTRLEA